MAAEIFANASGALQLCCSCVSSANLQANNVITLTHLMLSQTTSYTVDGEDVTWVHQLSVLTLHQHIEGLSKLIYKSTTHIADRYDMCCAHSLSTFCFRLLKHPHSFLFNTKTKPVRRARPLRDT